MYAINIEKIVNGSFQENGYIVWETQSKIAILFDPGDESNKFIQIIEDLELKPIGIYATHGHVDHIGAVSRLCIHFSIPFYIHQNDKDLVNSLPEYCEYFGITKADPPEIEGYISEEDEIMLAENEVHIIETPGHTQGGVCYLIGNHLISGDTLFNKSIGRTDLPGGNYNQLIESIKTKLLILDDKVIVYPGHGENTTIDQEKASNPFLS
jgi:hydroxyacylglutathione hydrolase